MRLACQFNVILGRKPPLNVFRSPQVPGTVQETRDRVMNMGCGPSLLELADPWGAEQETNPQITV